uniref:Uncharacterized protein n=1 Tax=Globisporangium ultimum (strain ATCC 200006 / CBS 805.95 / DAOM BR144) TaxID=431595 RepID=K3WIN0_GLOUD
MATPLFPTPAAADDNVIRYALFFARDHVNAKAPASPVDPAATALNAADEELQFVQQRCVELLAFAHERTREFIWQRHRFHLQPAATASLSVGNCPDDTDKSDLLMAYHLAGETSVGDEIQDEWVVTWLLWEITKRHPNVLVRVQDSDGEFLLIECADVLPEWVHPENSDGRVLLKDGVLHLVPPTVVNEPPQSHSSRRRRKSTAGANGGTLTPLLRDCMHAVLRDSARTEASGAVQHTLEAKLNQVPSFMTENRHRIRCMLPRKAVRVLKRIPGVLGAAVEAFYYREPKQATSICTRMDVFLPTTEAQSSSPCMVTFSRCMFAQLKQQQFFAPKPFQRHPEYSALASGSLDHDDAKSKKDDAAVASLAADIGMKLTCGLEILYATSAKDQFGAVWRYGIDKALEVSDDDGVQEPADEFGANDDDSWLYVHPDSLEEKLKQVEASMGVAKSGDRGAGDDFGDSSGGAEELENIATMFNNFLGGISGIDGVEGNEPIQFDMSAFMEILNGDGSGPQREPRFSEGGDYFYEDDDDDDSLIHSSDKDSDDDDEADARMEAAMAEMDAELATSKMGKSFASSRFEEIDDETAPDLLDEDEVEVDAAADKPLDLDFNLLSNLLESFASQEGHAGPVSNILNEMNFPRSR